MTALPVARVFIEAIDGDIAGAIIQLAHAENIPLIVMGGRGKGLSPDLSSGASRRGCTAQQH